MFEFRKKEFETSPTHPHPRTTPGSNSVQNVMKKYKKKNELH